MPPLEGDNRYSRQILFPGIGVDGQRKLAAARVAIVGCGATGSSLASLLARSGVGLLRIVDRDYVEPSNLQRQTLFDESDAAESVPKAIAVILVGILLSTIGTDLESGEERLTFGWTEISDGLDVAVIAMGMFGFAEIMRNLEMTQTRDVVHAAIGNLLPNRKDMAQ